MDHAMFAIARDVKHNADDMRVFDRQSDESIAAMCRQNDARLSVAFRCV
jgi:hypothetical protein